MKIINSTKPSVILLILLFSSIGQARHFLLSPLISLPSYQTAVAAADLNEDGAPDLILGGEPTVERDGKIRVLLGRGDGTFGSPTEYIVGYNGSSFYNSPIIRTIKTADLDADGHLDVVVTHVSHTAGTNFSYVFATVLFGTGDGRLLTAEGYRFLDQFGSVAVDDLAFGDFNRDGRTDIVIGAKVNGSTGTAYFLNNDGNRNFTRKYFPLIDSNIYEIAAADIDGDSDTDLIMTLYDGLLIFYGSGNYFASNSRYERRERGIYEIGLTVGDFNGDGRPDIAVAERAARRFRVYLNSSAGLPEQPVIYETENESNLLKGTDLNGDGRLDLVVSDNYNGDFQIFYGAATGTFGSPESVPVQLPVSDYTFADFDRNGRLDIAFSLNQIAPGAQAGLLLNQPRRPAFDFDGDGRADLAVFRPSSGIWYLQQSSIGFTGAQFGLGSDKIVPADYDGDGKTDLAVYRSGVWYLQRSSQGFTGIRFGTSEDVPMPADYDGDGTADLAVFRPSSGAWYLLQSTAGFFGTQFGQTGDRPVAADYDGDGKADLAVYRNGVWYLNRSQQGFTGIQFGTASDLAAPSDYDGDGKADLAVFRPATGEWYLQQSSAGFTGVQFGQNGDAPATADYDGDGKADLAVYRSGVWYLNRSTAGFTGVNFGTGEDQPIPNAFVR